MLQSRQSPFAEGVRNLLTTPLTTIIGREQETGLVLDLLSGPDGRLVTLTGPGGVGKTRIADHVAKKAAWFEDGVVAVSLEAIESPARLILTILQVTGAPDEANQPPLLRLARHIGDRHLLLLLDNFEQVVDAAPQLIRLLQRCPRLRILTTSRIALNVSAERIVRIAPFAIPPVDMSRGLDELASSEPVQLFVERARAKRPDFGLTRENASVICAICERADGLPLAIELVAARLSSLTPLAVLEGMGEALSLLTGGPRDAPERQRSLHNAIAWSYNLLSPDHAELFRTISIFASSFTLGDVTQVVFGQPGPVPIGVLDGINSLASNSLLQRTESNTSEPRFYMLATVRAYAREQLALDASAAREVRDRHARWCLNLERDPRDGTRDRVTGPWLDTIELYYADISLALDWLVGSGALTTAMDLAVVMAPFWGSRGRRSEGRQWLESVAAQDAASAFPNLRVHALQWAAVLAAQQGDDESTLRLADALLDSLADLEDRGTAGEALRAVSFVEEFAGQYDRALANALRSVQMFGDLPDHPQRPWALLRLAVAHFLRAEYDPAEELLVEALAGFQHTGSLQGNFFALVLRGQIAHARGAFSEAATAFLQGLEVHASLYEAWGTADFFIAIAGLAASQDDALDAATFLGAASRSFERSRTTPRPCNRAVYRRALDATRVLLGPDLFDRLVADGRRMELDYSFALASVYLSRMVDLDERPPATSGAGALTGREIEVLALIVGGRSDREIASALQISRRTASTHVAHILKKLSASSRAEAAALAVRLQIV